MSETVGDLNQKQADALRKFQDNLKDTLHPSHDDYYLLRWLRARNFNLESSEAMLRKHLQWRKEMNADTVLDWEPPEVLKQWYIGGIPGVDKEGSPIWIEPAGYLDMKGILHSVKKSDLIRFKIKHCELLQQMMRDQSKMLGRRIETFIIICDFEKYGLRHLWKPAIDIFMEILGIFEAHYPESLKRTYVINVPRVLPLLYRLGKPFISEDTRRKIIFLGNNWKSRLLEDIDPDQLPVRWGGTAVDPDGNPWLSTKVGMGGEVPARFYVQRDAFYDLSTFTKVTVKRGSSVQMEYIVEHPNSLIQYQFCTDSKDIAFGLFRKTATGTQKVVAMETMQTTKRASCALVPEEGTVTCAVPGTYVVQFDNSYSWFSSKKLYYQIQVVPPDDMESLQKSPSFAVPPGPLDASDL